MLSSVLLPLPEGPTKATSEPRSIVKLASRTAGTATDPAR
jgi:hypothetical protein